ncbi:hypothetical protein WOLCODRAFT_163999 [Wolfiporia cocos MD-104 SS10]|uniref:Uncharacterized protein n=1 Tax=Wolfiporia cocos (strain MD-104) TaxID=742152 RepID=A0A2H3JLJ3_WOLCO|nr:hypothetical protein WOLCODRAFT_163999 [Wolfiporia cocos MD-104 SS10]
MSGTRPGPPPTQAYGTRARSAARGALRETRGSLVLTRATACGDNFWQAGWIRSSAINVLANSCRHSPAQCRHFEIRAAIFSASRGALAATSAGYCTGSEPQEIARSAAVVVFTRTRAPESTATILESFDGMGEGRCFPLNRLSSQERGCQLPEPSLRQSQARGEGDDFNHALECSGRSSAQSVAADTCLSCLRHSHIRVVRLRFSSSNKSFLSVNVVAHWDPIKIYGAESQRCNLCGQDAAASISCGPRAGRNRHVGSRIGFAAEDVDAEDLIIMPGGSAMRRCLESRTVRLQIPFAPATSSHLPTAQFATTTAPPTCQCRPPQARPAPTPNTAPHIAHTVPPAPRRRLPHLAALDLWHLALSRRVSGELANVIGKARHRAASTGRGPPAASQHRPAGDV